MTTRCFHASSASVAEPEARGHRVLCLINDLGAGGAERSLAELLPFFTAGGIEPIVVCQHTRNEGVQLQVAEASYDVRFLSGNHFSTWVRELRALIRSEAVDLVHTTIFESDLAGRFAAARTGIPVLSSLVNTSYEPVRLSDPNVNRLKLWAAKEIDGWTGRHMTTHFHAITQAVRDAAIRALKIPPERITVIERGRDQGRLGTPSADRRQQARRALDLGEDDEVIVTVGRQDFQKGQRFLLEAMGRLTSHRPFLRLLMAGRIGHASAELHGIHERLGIGSRARFLGYRDDVPEILAAADLFVFPSLYEGMGGSVIEAMALGLPVVASDIPALRELLEEGRNALLVPVGSSEALATAIERMLDDQATAHAFGKRSQEIFQERFTIEKSATRMIQLYRDVIGAAGDSR